MVKYYILKYGRFTPIDPIDPMCAHDMACSHPLEEMWVMATFPLKKPAGKIQQQGVPTTWSPS